MRISPPSAGTPSIPLGFYHGAPAMKDPTQLFYSPLVPHHFPAGDTHPPSGGRMSSYMGVGLQLAYSPSMEGEGSASGNSPPFPCSPTPLQHDSATGLRQPHLATDSDKMLSAFASQLSEPMPRSEHTPPSFPSDTHSSSACTGHGVAPWLFAGQPGFPVASPLRPPQGLARTAPEVIESIAWGSREAGLPDTSLLAHGSGLAHAASSTLFPHAADHQITADAVAATSAGLPARNALQQQGTPMQTTSQLRAQSGGTQAPARPSKQAQRSPSLQNAHHPCNPQGIAVHPDQHGKVRLLPGARPRSPAGSFPDWSHQQSLLGDWGLDMPAACTASAALSDNPLLDSLGMLDIPGFLSSPAQPQAGSSLAAWDGSRFPEPGIPASRRLSCKGHPRVMSPTFLGPHTSQPRVSPRPPACQATPPQTALQPPSPQLVTSMPHISMGHSKPFASASAIRPRSQAFPPIITGGQRPAAASPPPTCGVGSEAMPDLFNFSSLASFGHLPQKDYEKAVLMPTDHATPKQHAALSQAGLSRGAPAASASQLRP